MKIRTRQDQLFQNDSDSFLEAQVEEEDIGAKQLSNNSIKPSDDLLSLYGICGDSITEEDYKEHLSKKYGKEMH